ncbi:glycosyl hydrolase [Paenibacillus spiritus]|uniref:Glycosyl hydrolase n=1 Tax=Paenibacillus spiritus TaxID=2496557 RepID=A0A5J5FZK2_9BACL|nr:stalk domain-containing protein [Paenibacillus spiritus]KAA8999778.1 glycosyl hydrolase [Paenibacillus spiritus]
MKKWTQAALAVSLLLGGAQLGGASAVQAAGDVTIILDGYPLPFPQPPAVVNGTTMVPFRAISEALGIGVVWNPSAKTITAVSGAGEDKLEVVLAVGSKTAKVNGNPVRLREAPRMTKGTTLIPLSFFSEQFGANVSWNQTSKTVSILSPKSDLYTLGFYAIASYDEASLMPAFDDIAFGWSRLDDNGHYTTSGSGGDSFYWPKASGDVTPESLVGQASASGTSYLMVGSGDKKLQVTKNLEDPALQAETIAGIMETAVGKGFGGVMLDLEGIGMTGDKARARADFNAFVRNLSVKTKAQGLKLGVALHPINSSYTGYDYKTLGGLADELVIMAYGYGDEKSPEPAAKVDEAIRLALAQTPKDKLVLGISTASESTASIGTKIGLAKRYGLKGVAFWRLGLIGSDWQGIDGSLKLNADYPQIS